MKVAVICFQETKHFILFAYLVIYLWFYLVTGMRYMDNTN